MRAAALRFHLNCARYPSLSYFGHNCVEESRGFRALVDLVATSVTDLNDNACLLGGVNKLCCSGECCVDGFRESGSGKDGAANEGDEKNALPSP